MNEVYIAHIREDGETQTVKDHLSETAELAEKFAAEFFSGTHAFYCGLYHDAGKYSQDFQRRIRGGSDRVDHSTAGAQELNKIKRIGKLLAYCVAGHHAGLPDSGAITDENDATLSSRLKKEVSDYSAFFTYMDARQKADNSLNLPLTPPPRGMEGFAVSFWIRMLFSCLVDADYLNTEEFMLEKQRELSVSLKTLCDKVLLKADKFLNSAMDKKASPLNMNRNEVLRSCLNKACLKKGFFRLTVPTGGGKTFASLAFAFKHAHINEMKRVIYVIPYNTVIDQNAEVIGKIVGEENVLEHHSDVEYDFVDGKYDTISQRKITATENWDAPLIMTSSVQFFESLFSNKSSKCRKLHNLANSVIILDEAQMLPQKYMRACVAALEELVENYGVSVVLCTATQPALDIFLPRKPNIEELADDLPGLFSFFKRAEFIELGQLPNDNLIEMMLKEKQALCIVNSRKHAQVLYERLKSSAEGVYHLSTLMCPKHRRATLAKIKARLDNKGRCLLVSTSLLEAGVDIDFPIVLRAHSGLDSEIQAAGRCNREGELGLNGGKVYLFTPEDAFKDKTPRALHLPMKIAETVRLCCDDPFSLQSVQAYFKSFYDHIGEGLDGDFVLSDLNDGYNAANSYPFKSVAQKFKLIEDASHKILIPWDDKARSLIAMLCNGNYTRANLRELQKYTVNVYDRDFCDLASVNAIRGIDEEYSVLDSCELYNDSYGLKLNDYDGYQIF